MKKFLLVITALLASASATASDQQQLAAQAVSAIKQLGGTLKGELQAAMKSGGPVAAVEVCQKRAPEIAAEVATNTGMQLGRVSLKPRNEVLGKPNDWQQTVLEQFDARQANGEAAKDLVYREVVKHDGKEEFRFMKAIETKGVCLSCHGPAETLQPALMERLHALYPEDTATGYEFGQIRGAFYVVKPLN